MFGNVAVLEGLHCGGGGGRTRARLGVRIDGVRPEQVLHDRHALVLVFVSAFPWEQPRWLPVIVMIRWTGLAPWEFDSLMRDQSRSPTTDRLRYWCQDLVCVRISVSVFATDFRIGGCVRMSVLVFVAGFRTDVCVGNFVLVFALGFQHWSVCWSDQIRSSTIDMLWCWCLCYHAV